MQNRSLIGNPKILQISALGAGETDGIKFLRTKGISDKILLESKNTYVIRPSIICTPGTMLVRKFKMLKKLIVGLRHYLVVPKGFLESQVQPLMIADLVDVVKKISIKADNERIIDVVGPEKLSFGDLLSMAAKTFNHPLKIKTLNKGVVTSLVKYLVSPLFPNLISFEQYQLLFTDNVAQSEVMERILGRKPASTVEFWEKELQ
jgi:uncharacterized protein YbjT (DUF2867 family)